MLEHVNNVFSMFVLRGSLLSRSLGTSTSSSQLDDPCLTIKLNGTKRERWVHSLKIPACLYSPKQEIIYPTRSPVINMVP